MISTVLSFVAGALTVAWAVLAFMIGYLLLLVIAAARTQRMPPPARDRRTFRIIVPAHNEELVLAPVLQRLTTLQYPRTHYEVVVVADNCDDDTATIARSYGTRVLERRNPHARGKGHALAAAFAVLRNERVDAYVVLDADTLADPMLLQVFNRYLAAGHDVIQAHYDVLNAEDNHRTALMAVALRIFHYVRPLGRRVLGGNATLTGNGMCLGKNVIDRHPWNAFSLTEDLEYTSTLVRNNQPIMFAPEAQIAAQMPIGRAQAHGQRLRWEGGRLQIARRDGLRFLWEALRQRSFRRFDWAMDLLIPPLAALALAVLAGIVVAAVVAVLAPSATTITLVCMWAALMGALAVFVLDALMVGRAPAAAYRALLFVPGYVLWKLWVYAVLATQRRSQQWTRTGRTRFTPRGPGR
jgi:1,2-diacylglycerol 3-beta-glucosyltransferase